MTYRLTHVICEDIGLCARARRQAALRDRIADGVEGSGFALGSSTRRSPSRIVSFEGRSGSLPDARRRGRASSMSRTCCAVDLGRSSRASPRAGASPCTCASTQAHDPHHAWEAAFRAFGRALRAALWPPTPGAPG